MKKLYDALCFRLFHGPLRKPTFQINKLKLNEGDILVCKVDGRITRDTAKSIQTEIQTFLPPLVRAFVIDDGLDLSVLAKNTFIEATDGGRT